MGLIAVAAAYLTFDVIRFVKGRERASQVSIGFNTENAVTDVRLLFIGEAVLLLGFLLMGAGAVFEHHNTVTVGEGLVMLFLVSPLTVLYRWRRRLS